METATGDGGEGPRPEHFDGADGARTENDKHLHRKYDNVASEATERGQDSAGGDAGEDVHGSTKTSAGQTRAEEGGENPQRALTAQEPNGGETEKSPPPKQSRALNTSGLRGGEGGG